MRHILIIDDDQEFRSRQAHILSQAGYQVTEADGWDMLLELAIRVHPNLILIAIVMSDQNGLTVAKQLRALIGFESIPIILSTHLPPLGIDEDPRSSFVNGYIDREIAPDEFVEKIRSYLD